MTTMTKIYVVMISIQLEGNYISIIDQRYIILPVFENNLYTCI